MSTKDFEKCAAESNNACKTNYIASILFKDAIPNELIKRIFDEE